jgi:hypothetical protein
MITDSKPVNDDYIPVSQQVVAEEKSHMGKIIGLLGGLSLGAITSSIVCCCAPGALAFLLALLGIPFATPAVIAVVIIAAAILTGLAGLSGGAIIDALLGDKTSAKMLKEADELIKKADELKNRDNVTNQNLTEMAKRLTNLTQKLSKKVNELTSLKENSNEQMSASEKSDEKKITTESTANNTLLPKNSSSSDEIDRQIHSLKQATEKLAQKAAELTQKAAELNENTKETQ